MRKLHFYLGAFFGPLILFFAVTGGLQAYSLHKTYKDGSYTAPQALEVAGSLHSNQFANRSKINVDTKACDGLEPYPKYECVNQLRQKRYDESIGKRLYSAFLALLAVGLSISAVSGMLMGFQMVARRKVFWILVVSGVSLTFVLIYLQSQLV